MIIFGIPFLVFLLAAGIWIDQEGRDYSFSFDDGAVTFSDGELNAVVLKGDVMSFYGGEPLTLTPTDLTDGSKLPFVAARVTFTNIFSSPNHVDYSVGLVADPFKRENLMVG